MMMLGEHVAHSRWVLLFTFCNEHVKVISYSTNCLISHQSLNVNNLYFQLKTLTFKWIKMVQNWIILSILHALGIYHCSEIVQNVFLQNIAWNYLNVTSWLQSPKNYKNTLLYFFICLSNQVIWLSHIGQSKLLSQAMSN